MGRTRATTEYFYLKISILCRNVNKKKVESFMHQNTSSTKFNYLCDKERNFIEDRMMMWKVWHVSFINWVNILNKIRFETTFTQFGVFSQVIISFQYIFKIFFAIFLNMKLFVDVSELLKIEYKFCSGIWALDRLRGLTIEVCKLSGQQLFFHQQ